MQTTMASTETGISSLRGFWDVFSYCNGSAAFSAREAVNPINLIIWVKKPFMRIEMCL
jgi:hypothetical protein